MFCAIWYHLYNLKNVKNTHGGVLLLVKLNNKIPVNSRQRVVKFIRLVDEIPYLPGFFCILDSISDALS